VGQGEIDCQFLGQGRVPRHHNFGGLCEYRDLLVTHMEVISQVEDGSVTLLVDFEVAIVSTQVHVVQSESQLHGISRPWQIYLTRFEYLSVSHVGNELNFL
jgi:hypothetical protein